MKDTKHPIFTNEDDWFQRILFNNAIPKKIKTKFTALKATKVMRFNALTIIGEFLNYVPLTKDNIPACTKKRLLQIVLLLKSSTNLPQFKTMNGPWFEKLLSPNGVHDDDMTSDAIELIYECLSHAYMMMLLEHDFVSNNVHRANYSYRCNSGEGTLYYNCYVYFSTKTSLKLKGEFKQVKARAVYHTELAQYYTYIFGLHTKLFIQTAKSINEFVFGKLPLVDKDAVVNAASVIENIVSVLTKDLIITKDNIAKIETLIGTSTFLMTDINNALVELDSSVNANLHKSKTEIGKLIESRSVRLDGTTGSIADLIVAQTKNQAKSFANIGLWMHEAFRDIRGKQPVINGGKRCSICTTVDPANASATLGGTFAFGIILGYAVKKITVAIAKKKYDRELVLAAMRAEHYDLETLEDVTFDVTDL